MAAEAGAAESGGRPALCPEEIEARAAHAGGNDPGLRRAGVVEGLGGREGGRGEQCRPSAGERGCQTDETDELSLPADYSIGRRAGDLIGGSCRLQRNFCPVGMAAFPRKRGIFRSHAERCLRHG